MTRKSSINQNRKLQFEQFEQRLVMSAQAVTSLLPEMDIASPALTQQVVSLEDAGTQAQAIASQYNFDGSGQTVAVIDSGIAFDHLALGGGFGEGHKVVGGYDFAENDANPYDDGPAGFHGTHVAGIIGSSDEQYSGVAPGADLVGLRVFDDAGRGNLEWVEQALQWVHDNKDAFEHPITTVNLSLGTDWNADTVPEWATLEDEFAQLEADGLFISVAAGNGFLNFGETGLSYPAVSEHVVPVASHDADGNLSDFSQRDERVLVAPGEFLRSTAPDHLFVGGKTDQFLASTGTSQAAPYVAGASAILRQANEFVGTENINQELLYQQFLDSADQVYDSVTGGYYSRINLEAALDAVVKDLHSDSIETATDAGTLGGGETIEGTIGKIADVDSFQFTAERSGSLTLNFEVTDDLVPLVDVIGSDATIQGNQITFDVVAGQTYEFVVASSEGNGHYQISVELPGATTGGITGGTNDQAASNDSQSSQRNNTNANTNPGIVWVNNGTLTVVGSDGDDDISVTADSNQGNFLITVNGNDYQYSQTGISHVNVLGQNGDDSISVQLGSENDTANTHADGLSTINEKFGISASGFQTVNLSSGGGYDVVSLTDSQGNDTLTGRDTAQGYSATLTNGNYSSTVTDFDLAFVGSTGGADSANIVGTTGNDVFISRGHHNVLRVDGTNLVFNHFTNVNVDGGGGQDRANLNDSAGNERYVLAHKSGTLFSANSTVSVNDFSRINAFATRGHDTVELRDSTNATSNGNDIFDSQDGRNVLYGEGYLLYAGGFDSVEVISTGGNDIAQIYDTAGNDVLYSSGGDGELVSAEGSVAAKDFKVVNLIANRGGHDRAIVTGTDGNDAVHASGNVVRVVNSNGQTNRVRGADVVDIDLGRGVDLAFLTGTTGDDTLTGDYDSVELETTLQMLRLTNVEHTEFDGNGGNDEVDLDDLDLLESFGDQATAYLEDRTITAEDFAILEARSVDSAIADYSIEAADYLYLLRGQWAKK